MDNRMLSSKEILVNIRFYNFMSKLFRIKYELPDFWKLADTFDMYFNDNKEVCVSNRRKDLKR